MRIKRILTNKYGVSYWALCTERWIDYTAFVKRWPQKMAFYADLFSPDKKADRIYWFHSNSERSRVPAGSRDLFKCLECGSAVCHTESEEALVVVRCNCTAAITPKYFPYCWADFARDEGSLLAPYCFLTMVERMAQNHERWKDYVWPELIAVVRIMLAGYKSPFPLPYAPGDTKWWETYKPQQKRRAVQP